MRGLQRRLMNPLANSSKSYIPCNMCIKKRTKLSISFHVNEVPPYIYILRYFSRVKTRTVFIFRAGWKFPAVFHSVFRKTNMCIFRIASTNISPPQRKILQNVSGRNCVHKEWNGIIFFLSWIYKSAVWYSFWVTIWRPFGIVIGQPPESAKFLSPCLYWIVKFLSVKFSFAIWCMLSVAIVLRCYCRRSHIILVKTWNKPAKQVCHSGIVQDRSLYGPAPVLLGYGGRSCGGRSLLSWRRRGVVEEDDEEVYGSFDQFTSGVLD